MTVKDFKEHVASFPEEYDSCELFMMDYELCKLVPFYRSLQAHIVIDESDYEVEDLDVHKGEKYVALEISI